MSLLIAPQSLSFRLANCRIRLTTNRQDYLQYLSSWFNPLLQKEPWAQPELDLQVFWEPEEVWDKRFQQLKKSPGFWRVGDDTFLAGKRLVAVNKILGKSKALIEYETTDKCSEFSLRFPWKKGKDFWRYEIFKKPGPFSFFTLTYFGVYYPMFWYLEAFRDQHFLHASAISLNGKGFVFCGMEGVGKTTLAVSLLKNQESRFLSDNLVIYDKESVYPCYEQIRICHGDETEHIAAHFTRVEKHSAYKDCYIPKNGLFQDSVRPCAFVFPVFSDHDFIRELLPAEACRWAHLLSYLPSELGHYQEFRHLYNLAAVAKTPDLSENECLQELLNKTKSLMIGMPKEEGLEKNLKKLSAFLAKNF